MYQLGSSVSHTVHFIIDFRASKASPAKLLSTGRHVDNKKTSNMGLSVILGANPFIKAMMVMAEKMYLGNMTTRHADTIEDAYEMIQKYQQKQLQKQ